MGLLHKGWTQLKFPIKIVIVHRSPKNPLGAGICLKTRPIGSSAVTWLGIQKVWCWKSFLFNSSNDSNFTGGFHLAEPTGGWAYGIPLNNSTLKILTNLTCDFVCEKTIQILSLWLVAYPWTKSLWPATVPCFSSNVTSSAMHSFITCSIKTKKLDIVYFSQRFLNLRSF